MNITNKLRAGYPGIYIVTHEEARAEAALRKTAEELKWKIFAWTITTGRFNVIDGQTYDEDVLGVLDSIEKLDEKSLLILKDYHLHLDQPLIFRKLKDALFLAKTQNKCIIILAPVLFLPTELEKLFAVVDLPLPDREQLKEILHAICKNNEKKMPKGDALLAALDAARGLTSTEAEDAFSLAIVESGTLDPIIVAREKAETIRKNGILELVEPTETIADIGGLDVAKAWLEKRRNAFGEEAKKYGLPVPKGLLVFGIQGTGKSLLARICKFIFNNIPLVRLDAGAIFAKHVGESERNIRTVIKLCEAISPCILWIDEIEKGFGRTEADTDAGTSARVFGTLLQWMNDKTAPVFVVATANEVRKLDPALVRKGRFDEIFFVDLPDAEERRQIWEIQIAKYNRLSSEFDIKKLVEITAGSTGAEIEALFCEALYVGFENGREPNLLDIVEQTEDFVPLSKMMEQDVTALRTWAKGRARRASTLPKESKARKLA
jgi:AAA+ superfamily predicted ATPase